MQLRVRHWAYLSRMVKRRDVPLRHRGCEGRDGERDADGDEGVEVHRDKPFRVQRASSWEVNRAYLRPWTVSAAGTLHTIRAAIISPMSMQTIGNQSCAAKRNGGVSNLAPLGASGMLPEKLSPRCVSSELDVARQRDVVD